MFFDGPPHSEGTVLKRKLDKASMVVVGWLCVCVGRRELGSARLDVGQNWDHVPQENSPNAFRHTHLL